MYVCGVPTGGGSARGRRRYLRPSRGLSFFFSLSLSLYVYISVSLSLFIFLCLSLTFSLLDQVEVAHTPKGREREREREKVRGYAHHHHHHYHTFWAPIHVLLYGSRRQPFNAKMGIPAVPSRAHNMLYRVRLMTLCTEAGPPHGLYTLGSLNVRLERAKKGKALHTCPPQTASCII